MDYKLLKDLNGKTKLSNKIATVKSGTIFKEKYGMYYPEGVDTSGLSKAVMESNPEWFEPIYKFKVGGYYRVGKLQYDTTVEGNIIKIISCKQNFYDYETIQGEDESAGFNSTSNFAKSLTELSQSEIDSVTKKFPFEMLGVTVFDEAENTLKLQAGSGGCNNIWISKGIWEEIGKRKGWAL